jgi:hypothetical protein
MALVAAVSDVYNLHDLITLSRGNEYAQGRERRQDRPAPSTTSAPLDRGQVNPYELRPKDDPPRPEDEAFYTVSALFRFCPFPD